MSKTIKYCILNPSKICDDCKEYNYKECERCDLDPSKICDNCGKCLNLDDDYREVKIDGIVPQDEQEEYEKDLDHDADDRDFDKNMEPYDDYDEQKNGEDENLEYIDDVDGLDEILNDKEKYDKNIIEKYPGLLVLKKEKE